MLFSKIEGQGFPLLILHGFLGMSDNWKTLATKYAEQGFQVHALDLRNHGKSFHSDDFNYQIMVQDVVNYCKFHHLTSVNLIGHSMGGKVVMLLATVYPELVNKLVVADIGPKFYPAHHQTILAALNAVDFSKKPSRTEAEAIVSKYISDFGTRQFLLKNLYWQEPGQLAFRFNLKVFNEKIESIGKALPFNNIFKKETLFLRGDKSDYILDSDFETILHHFPKAEIQTISNAGHWLHAENPADFFEKTIQFFKKKIIT
ncbi:alpha/beta fold hydrolase [Flavobacterium psychrophilum]|uniref:alpha/beta fold hydrolase n=1 Tax=Flavobacterium psychrophilum TaxID=96345 RepID=UPI00054B2347|nr:alpha/beta fold hydrolase [Flavobacterium psychrophilum]EKT2068626.1 alpha/beta fold hydrolase [Flavobacterium psychrophilum]EKT2070731.1 alpha/beta fold hydrolase [Flavobacterium psychrophilum]EKT4490240.1 alpha/beta fold hydrolase [Flavobacterium psychrophilum]ELV7523971.1 alpha/beta fold hydrolase [Flavobacterium psychrophilum]MBF2043786.1 alpha/beta fold hydrolase [Flavobacterium psychrophilum]